MGETDGLREALNRRLAGQCLIRSSERLVSTVRSLAVDNRELTSHYRRQGGIGCPEDIVTKRVILGDKTFICESTRLVFRTSYQDDLRGKTGRLGKAHPMEHPWAKLKHDQAGVAVSSLSLEDHCADVAAVLEALLTKTVMRKRLGRLLGQSCLDDTQIARLGFLAALHDVGKVNHGFQARAQSSDTRKVGHVSPFIDFMHWDGPEKEAIVEALQLETLCGWFEQDEDLIAFLLAAFCHHGEPVRPSPNFSPRLWRSSNDLDPIAEIRKLRKAAESWFPGAFLEPSKPFAGATEFQHAFNGLVTLADWIGSDEQRFPHSSDRREGIASSRKLAQAALGQLGLTPQAARVSLDTAPPKFTDIVPDDCSLRPIQELCASMPWTREGGLTIIEAETGSGKTEAALIVFLRLFRAGLVDGMYFALPTRTAATEIHKRITSAIKKLFANNTSRPPVILAVPGYLRVDDRIGKPLAPFDVLWDDDDRNRWRDRGWAAETPKRYLAGAVGVGTIDQVLLSALKVRHSELRATSLLRHLLVVDEVHASDTYMSRLLEEVLSHHLQAGGHALLMSATLGAAVRSRLMNGRSLPPPPLDDAKASPYPLVSVSAQGEVGREVLPEPSLHEKCVRVQSIPYADNEVQVAEIALDAAQNGARVLIIRNTVHDCISTQLALEQLAKKTDAVLFGVKGIPAPHHSRFSVADRKSLDRAIGEAFGKNSQSNGVVAVATQTVQQSLDLDADLLVSDLCPIDVLLQRVGRLHRHQDTRTSQRPASYAAPTLLVLVPEERALHPLIRPDGRASGSHGYGTVYEDLRMIEAIWQLVEQHSIWTLPAMNRMLVEGGTHPEALSIIAESLGGRWLQHSVYLLGLQSAKRTQAGLVLIQRNHRFGDDLFPKDLSDRIKTRLGEGDRTLKFDTSIIGPFGNDFDQLTLPAHFAMGCDVEATVVNVSTESGRTVFGFGGTQFAYDRQGLRKLESHCEEAQ